MFRGGGDRSRQQQQAAAGNASSAGGAQQPPSHSPSRMKESSFGSPSGSFSVSGTGRDNASPVALDTEEVSLPAVEMLIRNLEMDDDAEQFTKEEDAKFWEEEEDEDDDDDDDEGLDGPAGGDALGEDRDMDGEGSKKDADENPDDDEMGAEEDVSLSGANDSAIPAATGQKGAMRAASSFASTFKKIGVFVKRELNKRKTGGGSRRTMAKVQLRKKETQELTGVHCVQRLAAHVGPVWVMECSPSPGTYMATGGRDGKIVVWEMLTEPLSSSYNPLRQTSGGGGGDILRTETSSAASGSGSSPLPPPSPASPGHHAPKSTPFPPVLKPPAAAASSPTHQSTKPGGDPQQPSETDDQELVAGVLVTGPPVFKPRPYRVYIGHTSDVISISWSKSLFLASGSTDKTCRIWHISTESCLSILKHPDFVSAVDFHPLDDSLLLTGCFDKKLRFWDVAQSAVSQRVQCQSFITACRFNQSGDMAVAGLYTGHCVFYQMAPYGYGKALTAGMKYYTQIECRNKTGMQKKGRKVTSLRFITVREKSGPDVHAQEYMLVTTNESRSRLYNMDDFSLVRKYRGATNSSMLQIGATCSEDGRHIICGSEDRSVVVWRLKNDLVKTIFGGQGRRDMCDTYEAFNACTSGPVTASCFAPDAFVRARKARLNPQESVSPKLSSSIATATAAMNTGSSNGGGGGDGTEDDRMDLRQGMMGGGDELDFDEATRSSGSEPPPVQLQAEDDVGLGGAIILAAGFDGVVGIFEVSS